MQAEVLMTWRHVGLLAALLLAGCGGGSGGGSEPQPVTFQVTSVLPKSASEDVPLEEVIMVTFSKPVDEGSLTTTSFRVVAESGDEVIGIRTVTPLPATQVRFTPLSGYFPFATHTIEVTTDVLDKNGEPLDKDYSFQFRTEEEGPVLPVQDQVESKGNALNTGRFLHRMTRLADGTFLIAGGYALDGQPALASAERLFTTGTSQRILPGPLSARAAHVQVLLADGRVLLAGGEFSSFPFLPVATCEIFDPAAGTFASAASLQAARSFAHAVRLPDGRVLLTGGQGLANDGVTFIIRADAEIYDPLADTWTLVPSRMEAGRAGHFSAATPAGDAIIIGGTSGIPSATLWREDTGSFSLQLGTPFFAHVFGAGTVLSDGRPFVASGVGSQGVTIWDSRFGFVGAINQLPDERPFSTATAFLDGRVLLIGGFDLTASPPRIHDTIDVFHPIGATGRIFRADLTLPNPTSHHASALGADSKVWITGGIGTLGEGLRQVVAIRPAE
ncbi:MAG TPA: Ig-like domain-containing protein [Planctomycetota bacterium]|nr:Ig-like domain-containing protein [Planctomycetota bacterium]